MRSCYLDSNVLVYLQNEQSPFFHQAKEVLSQLIADEYSLCISTLVIDEFLYALKIYLPKSVSSQPDKYWKIIEENLFEILDLPNLQIINAPTDRKEFHDLVGLMRRFQLRPRDACHLLTMLSNQIVYLATFDRDFDRAFKLKIIHPFKV